MKILGKPIVILLAMIFLMGVNCRNLEYYHVEQEVRKELEQAKFSCRLANADEIAEYCNDQDLFSQPCRYSSDEYFVLMEISFDLQKHISYCSPYVASKKDRMVPMSLLSSRIDKGFSFSFVFGFDASTSSSVIFQNECRSPHLGVVEGAIRSDYFEFTALRDGLGNMTCKIKSVL